MFGLQSEKCYYLVSKVSDKLHLMQEQLDIPQHKVVQQVKTRWNSVYYMVERYFEQNEAIHTALCVLAEAICKLPFDKNHLCVLDQNRRCHKILQTFEGVTMEMSVEKYTFASKILPLSKALQCTASHTGAGGQLCDKLTVEFVKDLQTWKGTTLLLLQDF